MNCLRLKTYLTDNTVKKIISLLPLLLCVCALAQNPDFNLKYQQAKNLYEKGSYEQARTSIRSTLKLPGLSQEQKNEGNRLASQIDNSIAFRDRLNLGAEELHVGYRNGVDSITVDAGKLNSVTVSSSQLWCKVERKDNMLYVSTDFNPDKTPRQATVTVKMGKVKTKKIEVYQAQRDETTKHIILSTNPQRAHISVDGEAPVTGTFERDLVSGPHRFRIEKNGFTVKDTTIVVEDDLHNDQIVNYHINLSPMFARLILKVTPEEGFSFDRNPVSYRLNGVMVDSSPREVFSYDDDREIQRYSLYQDGSIPIPSGQLDIEVFAENYETRRVHYDRIVPGEELPVSFALKPVTGYLTLIDSGKARDAVAFLDGKEIGIVGEVSNKPVIIGEHVLNFQKEGYLSEEESYTVQIRQNESSLLNVAMLRYVPYVFTTAPSDARVIVDGVYVGNTPTKPYVLREKGGDNTFEITVAKEGYLTMSRSVSPDFNSRETVTEDFRMPETRKVAFDADGPDLRLFIRNRKNGDTTFVHDVVLPAEIDLPVRSKPYYVELYRPGMRSQAYKGHFRFNNPSIDRHHIQSFSKENFQILSGTYFLSGMPEAYIGTGNKEFKNMGTLNFMKFRLFPGLSTSVAKGGLFMGGDPETPITYSQQSHMGSVKTGTYNYLPAISFLFINEELRIGGAIFDYMDVNALATYAWYPDFIKSVFGFSHVVGHDIFIGAELSSRIPILNVSLRAGIQMYKGLTANIYDSSLSTSTDLSKNYIIMPVSGIPESMFVISASFSLGGKDSKGNNILRVF